MTLSGFADQRGDSDYNKALSEQRNLSVENYLMKRNVPEHQIITQAFGEESLVNTQGEYEKHIFDRRVALKVNAKGGEADMTASTKLEP